MSSNKEQRTNNKEQRTKNKKTKNKEQKTKKQKTRMPYFSLIIPAYNRAFYLPKAINSVVAQTYTEWELIGAEISCIH